MSEVRKRLNVPSSSSGDQVRSRIEIKGFIARSDPVIIPYKVINLRITTIYGIIINHRVAVPRVES